MHGPPRACYEADQWIRVFRLPATPRSRWAVAGAVAAEAGAVL